MSGFECLPMGHFQSKGLADLLDDNQVDIPLGVK